ncbi:hypothetical protein VTJ49DRAFT_6080 [Mycothermus thermophilus]|uniref:Uncharacterized protein n=1 Tax=Humicola insolens TaxID=85995 RepID=A0ABR3VK81_HUMIN
MTSSALAPGHPPQSTTPGVRKAHAPGTCPADPGKPSLAALPYELQAAIFEAAAAGPQVIFMDIANNQLTFSPPADQVLSRVCRLSREIYLKGKMLHRFGQRMFWLNRYRDIFYLRSDDPVPRLLRPTTQELPPVPVGDAFDRRLVHNVGVDLQYLGHFPRHDAVIRVWSVFPYLTAIHIFVPKGPPRTPALQCAPETLMLSTIPSAQVVAAPGHDKELWLAVRYQIRKVCTRIMASDHGWLGRTLPDVVGHFTSLLDNGSSSNSSSNNDQTDNSENIGNVPPRTHRYERHLYLTDPPQPGIHEVRRRTTTTILPAPDSPPARPPSTELIILRPPPPPAVIHHHERHEHHEHHHRQPSPPTFITVEVDTSAPAPARKKKSKSSRSKERSRSRSRSTSRARDREVIIERERVVPVRVPVPYPVSYPVPVLPPPPPPLAPAREPSPKPRLLELGREFRYVEGASRKKKSSSEADRDSGLESVRVRFREREREREHGFGEGEGYRYVFNE